MHAKDNDDSLPTPGVHPEALPVPLEAPSEQPVYEPYSKDPAIAEPAYNRMTEFSCLPAVPAAITPESSRRV